MFDKIELENIKEAQKAVLTAIVEDHDGTASADAQKLFNDAVDAAETSLNAAIADAGEQAQKLADEVTVLKGQVIELENDVKVANEKAADYDTQVTALQDEVKTLTDANAVLAEQTGEEHIEVIADPNKKSLTGEQLSAREVWEMAKAKAQSN